MAPRRALHAQHNKATTQGRRNNAYMGRARLRRETPQPETMRAPGARAQCAPAPAYKSRGARNNDTSWCARRLRVSCGAQWAPFDAGARTKRPIRRARVAWSAWPAALLIRRAIAYDSSAQVHMSRANRPPETQKHTQLNVAEMSAGARKYPELHTHAHCVASVSV